MMPRNSLRLSMIALALSLLSGPAHAAWDEHLKKLTDAAPCKAALFGTDGVQWATKADDHLIIGKHGTHGFIAVKSAKAVTLCQFDESQVTPGNALVATQNFADYLKSIGY